ncbi:MgtC/SapB family protein [Chroococcus sp. FPU101]|uniref:MgtC/SapB family protein n=1 Tax=Chroococcus sp. FPU101 TaxID=1974212 RepID=UPI001A8E196A|nr:MgtC/SapB family protein [Chroococcus sp. FPU101]GFE70522.1 MgtC/SapB transporter [Chroococcus sp. FPU101]
MFFSSDDWPSMIFRLVLAVLVGSAIGLNRQRSGRPAGLRTFMIVSLGAALFVMIPLQAERDLGYASSNALSRTIQGVASGVGFLGAGIILQQSHRELNKVEVKGLTSAAAIWLAAALGAAAGCGLWRMVLVGLILTLITLSGVKQLKKKKLSKLVYRSESAKIVDKELK